MKLCYSLFLLTCFFCAPQLIAQNTSNEFKKQVKNFNKAAFGLYEVRQTGADVPEGQKQQDLLIFPIDHWATATEAWFCFTWLSPKFKDKPLEQLLIRLTYKDAQTMNAEYYPLPENAPEGLSQEWKKAKPFAPMTADFVMTESQACNGFIAWAADGVYKMESHQPCPRDTKGAPYTSIQVDTRFYGKAQSSGVKFYAPDGSLVMGLNHEVQNKKVNINFKKY